MKEKINSSDTVGAFKKTGDNFIYEALLKNENLPGHAKEYIQRKINLEALMIRERMLFRNA